MFKDLFEDEPFQEQPTREKNKQKNYAYSTTLVGWNQLFLADYVKRAIRQCGFEHPSEIQVEAIPFALNGNDLICQAKSGYGKTAVFVISILNQLNRDFQGEIQPSQALILVHTRQLAHQIYKDFVRLGRYVKGLRLGCYFGGTNVNDQIIELRDKIKEPHIIIGTPGRIYDLMVKRKALNLSKIKFFVMDECDKMTQTSDNLHILEIIGKSMKNQQVLVFSATFSSQAKQICRKFMNNPKEICVDEGQLVLNGLSQFYINITQAKKFDRLSHLLDTLAFNQCIVFVNRVDRVKKLADLLNFKFFNPICIHSGLKQQERIKNYDDFKNNQSRVLVATDLFGRGIDIERVNLVINYDFPYDRDTYLHRVGRAGRFGTKGLAINFIMIDQQFNSNRPTRREQDILAEVQKGFKIEISELPNTITNDYYMT